MLLRVWGVAIRGLALPNAITRQVTKLHEEEPERGMSCAFWPLFIGRFLAGGVQASVTLCYLRAPFSQCKFYGRVRSHDA
jgi:hypothetical protein